MDTQFDNEHNNLGSTQLADQFPQVDLPQRISAPDSMKAPERKLSQSRNAQINEHYFSPKAHRGQISGQCGSATEKARNEVLVKSCFERHSSHHNQIKDLSILASSSRRAGNLNREAVAYFSTGVIYDNLDDYSKAVESYKKFAVACSQAENAEREALAYNCIGVDLMHLANESEMRYSGKFLKLGSKQLKQALKYHQRHLELADEAGQFVAHTNIGLVFGSLDRGAEAAKHHQEALRLAIKLQSTYGQAIAVGNLGLLASRQGDFSTACACMDQHLQLVQNLGDFSAESRAWTQLGILAHREGKFQQAGRYFEQACNIAKNVEEFGVQKQAHCHIGIAVGNQRMNAHMASLIN